MRRMAIEVVEKRSALLARHVRKANGECAVDEQRLGRLGMGSNDRC